MDIYVEYRNRLIKSIEKTVETDGVYRCKVKVYDLFKRTFGDKVDFFNHLTQINKEVGDELGIKVVLFLAD